MTPPATPFDLNCDMGEGLGNEASIMPYITSCSIACGAHAGDVATIDTVIRLAKAHKVHIGAHPSYPDRANFGRVSMAISLASLAESLSSQLQLFLERLSLANAALHHIKPHGALYNDAVTSVAIAEVFVEVMLAHAPNTTLYAPYHSEVARRAKKAGIPLCYEVFADRKYHKDLQLVSRTAPDALLTHPDAIVRQIQEILSGTVRVKEGGSVPIVGTTFCVHSDTPNAEHSIRYIYDTFLNS